MTVWYKTRLFMGVVLTAGLSFGALAQAERIAPALEDNLPVTEYAEPDPEEWTKVQELVHPHGFANMQIAIPQSVEDHIPTLKGSVNIEREFVPDVVFDDMHTIHKGEKLILVIMDFMASGYSQEGDKFTARVKEAVEQNSKVLIPKGALVKGHVEDVDDPGKILSQRAKITLAFDYILMPDGRKVPFKGEYKKGDSAVGAAARAVGTTLGHTIGGTIKGALLGLKFGGLGGAAYTNGSTLMVGGGLGGLVGMGNGLSRSGSNVMLNEGDEIKVALEEQLQLPVINVPPDTANEIHQDGLNVRITQYNLGRDPFKVENLITLSVNIDNQTDYKFGSFDLALVDEYNKVYMISPFGKHDSLIFSIPAHQKFSGDMSFSVTSPGLRHYLIFYRPYTRDIIAKVSLSEALKELSQSKPSKKTNIRRSS